MHLHEKVLERDMHARMQNSYARAETAMPHLKLKPVSENLEAWKHWRQQLARSIFKANMTK